MEEPEETPQEPLPLPVAMSPKLMREIATRYPASVICGHIDSLLNATVGKEGFERPDCRSVESGLKLVLAYSIGLPVQRQEIITQKITSAPTAAQLLKNPATIQAIIRQIADDPEGRRTLRNALKDEGREDWGEGGALVPA